MATIWNKKKERTTTQQEYWRRHSEGWEKSGLTQVTYCRKEGIPLSTFCNWRTKLNNEQGAGDRFVEIQSPITITNEERCFEITIPGAGTLRVREGISPELLRVIILTMREIA